MQIYVLLILFWALETHLALMLGIAQACTYTIRAKSVIKA